MTSDEKQEKAADGTRIEHRPSVFRPRFIRGRRARFRAHTRSPLVHRAPKRTDSCLHPALALPSSCLRSALILPASCLCPAVKTRQNHAKKAGKPAVAPMHKTRRKNRRPYAPTRQLKDGQLSPCSLSGQCLKIAGAENTRYTMLIGLTYDLRDDYLAAGYSLEETAEFDCVATIEAIEAAFERVRPSDRPRRQWTATRSASGGRQALGTGV